MANRLSQVRGRFLMSINDHEEIRRLFAGFIIEEVPTRYTVGGQSHSKQVTELIISN